jgi:hypothetical protein
MTRVIHTTDSHAVRLYAAAMGWCRETAVLALNRDEEASAFWRRVALEAEEISEENLAPFLRLHERFDRLRETLLLAQLLREAQKTYFRTRDRGDLIASKEAERAFDAALNDALKPGLALLPHAQSGDAA